MKIIDSTFVIDFLHNKKEAVTFLQSNQDEVVATPVVLFEVIRGALRKHADSNPAFDFFANIQMLDITGDHATKAAEISAELISEGQEMDDIDCLIAGAALVRGASIVTRNLKHFQRVKGLVVETY